MASEHQPYSRRARHLALRVLSWLALSGFEFWSVVLGVLPGLGFLAIYRVLLAVRLDPATSLRDLWRLQIGEIETWTGWGLVALVALRLGQGRLPVRLIFHGGAFLLAAVEAVEIAFFGVTGGRADLDSLAQLAEQSAQLLPVVQSEVRPLHLGALALLAVLTLAPLALLRPTWQPERRWWRLCTLAVLCWPFLHLQFGLLPKLPDTLKPLQRGLPDLLFYEWLDRGDEFETPPEPSELVPLEVEATPDAPQPNVVLVILESVGAGATSLSGATSLGGDALTTTPVLSKLAERGLVADHMTAVVPHTSKALVALHCGTEPYLSAAIKEAEPGGLTNRCLPALLGDLGYRTTFFQTARQTFEERAQLVRNLGFQRFRAQETLDQRRWEASNYFGLDDRALLLPGLASAREAAREGQPFFSTYLTLTSHHDYELPTHAPRRQHKGVRGRHNRYFNAVRYVDDFVGRLVAAHAALGLLEDTVFIVIGDHGEAFGEHDRSQHDLVIWEEGLRVPFVMFGPGVPVGRIEGPRSQIDLVATVLELVGARVTQGRLQGSSLLQPAPQRSLYHSCWRRGRCSAERTGELKIIEHFGQRAPEAFDLAADPAERHDLSPEQAAAVAQSRERQRAWRARVMGRYRAAWQAYAGDRPPARFAVEGAPVPLADGDIELLGCGHEERPYHAAEILFLACDLRAVRPVTGGLTLRLSLDAGGVESQQEWLPGGGRLPIWEWPVGQVVHQWVPVELPDSADGKVRIRLGFSSFFGRPLAGDAPVAEISLIEPEAIEGTALLASSVAEE